MIQRQRASVLAAPVQLTTQVEYALLPLYQQTAKGEEFYSTTLGQMMYTDSSSSGHNATSDAAAAKQDLTSCRHEGATENSYYLAQQVGGERRRDRTIEAYRKDNCNTNDRNWDRTKLRYSVEEFEGAKILYLKEGEYRGITRSKLRVVAKEDLWDMLVAAHQELSHGGRDRMHKYFLSHNYHVLRDVIALFVRFCAICQANKGRKSTLKVIITSINV
ncbi:hypothetical protein LOD99_10526 [Oopsacas minuta]|uniref:Integrase zinc-binding domain-containing protein n=1 Tax=Oopsacas minuta TaxID=111878 RepID=A0AAV7KG91_9METZ|nr:hypothetical protein LOD99_10526 [Oopsacas minuta]